MGRLRRLALLGVGGAVAAAIVDRWLAGQAARGTLSPPVIITTIEIDAPVERVWEGAADIEGQPRWMTEMKPVRLTTPGPVGVGTRVEAEVRIAGVGVADPVEIDLWEQP